MERCKNLFNNLKVQTNKYISNFLKYRFLLRELVINDIKIKYRRSVMGILWSVLHPLLMMIVLTIVFSSLFKSDIPNFAVYLLAGRLIWDLYSQATIFAMGSVVDNASLIKKVYVPKYIFPVAKSFSALVNSLFALIALFIVMIICKVKITPLVLLIPIPLFYTFIFALGVGLLFSAFNVFFRDLAYLYEVFLTAWMYFTPLFYPESIIPERYKIILKINPLYYYVNFFRDVVLYGKFPSVKENMICLSISFFSLIIGLYVFYKKQDKFILYI